MKQLQKASIEFSEPFKATEIGDFPSGWEVIRLGELFDVRQGKALSQAARRGISPRLFLRTTNVLWGKVDLTTVDQMDFTEEEAERLSLCPGDLLVCEGGEIGRSAVWNLPNNAFSYQNHIHRLRRKTEAIFPEFVMYWMQAAFLILRLYGGVGNKTTIPNLSGSRLKQLPIPVPPFSEQQSIASVLSKIQAGIEVQDKIVATLKELKAATMAKLFREGLRGGPLKQTEIGEIPESWEVVSLGNVAQEIFGGGTPSTKQPEYWGGDIHWTTSAYISGIYLREGQRQITRRGLVNSASSLVPAGNLLIGTRVGVGKVSVNLIDIAISQDLTALVVKKDRYNPEFLAFALLTDRCQNIFELQKRGATIKGIPRDDLLQIHLAVPGLPEQQEIARKLLALHDKIEITVRKRDTLKTLFSSILHLLMTGRVRVNHGTDD